MSRQAPGPDREFLSPTEGILGSSQPESPSAQSPLDVAAGSEPKLDIVPGLERDEVGNVILVWRHPKGDQPHPGDEILKTTPLAGGVEQNPSRLLSLGGALGEPAEETGEGIPGKGKASEEGNA